MTDPMELVGRLERRGRIHRARASGLQKRIVAGDRSVSLQDPQNAIREAETDEQAAACIREMVEKREGLEEDLYQAVLVAYRRGALEWTQLNYPQWINAISAGREVCPPAPGAEDE